MGRLLLIVDPQTDFITGPLPVPGAEKAMDGVAAYIDANKDKYACVAVTCDSHPAAHCSFQDNGGPWPRHCVAGTEGAAIWPRLAQSLLNLDPVPEIFLKGEDENQEEYSIFSNQAAAARFQELLRQREIDHIDICGLAGDICVFQTLNDGIDLLGSDIFHVLEEFSPSLDGGSRLRAFLKERFSCGR